MQPEARLILIVDDNEAHRLLIKRALRQTAFACTCIEATCLLEGKKMLLQDTPRTNTDFALAIIDLDLGDGRGTSLISELRTSSHYSKLPILVLSTSTLERDIHDSYRAGANCYLTKKDDFSVFSKELGNAINFLMR